MSTIRKNNTRIAVIFLLVMFCNKTAVFAQSNAGFESGLANWIISGDVSIDSSHAQEGKLCAKISNRASVMQRMNVLPFSVLQFDLQIKCSAEKIKGFSFIRFYDDKDQELLEYKSAAIVSASYVRTGNYTLAPPDTKYADMGIESDSSVGGDIYVDNLRVELNIGSPASMPLPQYNVDQYMHPFWKGDTVYNETVLMYTVNGKPATGKLLFLPTKILSVKNFDLGTGYAKNIDYSISGNIITRKANSKMPFRADTSFDRKNDLAWYNLQSQWIVVTYTHKDKWDGPVPVYKGNKIPKLISKLRSKSPVKIIAYGMSITKGLNVSSYDSVSPYMRPYVNLFADALKKKYGYDDIILYNAGLPGAIVSWAAEYAEKYINPVKPDLVIIDFGMNDFWRYKPGEFKSYVQTIIQKIKSSNPDVSFLLLSNMKFDPDYVLPTDKNRQFYLSNMEGYNEVMKQMETTGIINLDMTTLSDAIYHRKKAKDCIANPLHPNDYLARWYAQAMVALFK